MAVFGAAYAEEQRPSAVWKGLTVPPQRAPSARLDRAPLSFATFSSTPILVGSFIESTERARLVHWNAHCRRTGADMTSEAELLEQARGLIDAYRARSLMIATAESCTGGLVAAFLTEISGSSAVVDRAFVTYSNAAKQEMIGVPEMLIATYGAVSAAVAQAMAEGALRGARANVAVAITGIAGPMGGSADKPVGLVHFALAQHGSATELAERRFGAIGRRQIRLASVAQAFAMLADVI
jgi:nicotinamide-nucleotide amidase